MSISIQDLRYIYNEGTVNQTIALKNINLNISDGEIVGLIGHTGSGKSTLIQQLNGLLKPNQGRIIVSGFDISQSIPTSKRGFFNKKKEMQKLRNSLLEVRKRVGLVFQYPEYQLFEETIFKDVAFGPTNLGLSSDEIESVVKKSIEMVGLDFEKVKDRSPFDLSGGQKRRVAIAGVLAMQPDVLILDEPTAGLDPKGRDEILGQIRSLHMERKNSENPLTVIIVSHSMEDMSTLASRIVVMSAGEIALDGKPSEVFKHIDLLENVGLSAPQSTYLIKELTKIGIDIDDELFDSKAITDAIIRGLSA